jgi:regulator of ribonuclease activity A
MDSDKGTTEMSFTTADLVDAHSDVVKSCEAQFRQYGGRVRFHGPIRTVKSTEDNALLKQTLSTAGDGAVLVVDGGGSLRSALVGDLIAGLGQKNGWAGLVIWGAVRDTVALGGVDIGIKALGSNPWRSSKNGTGQVDVPVSFGGVEFRPGNWLYSDEDGILVSSRRL